MTKILVVDDDCDAAETLALLLRGMGHEVMAIFCGEDAVFSAEALQPHLIFLDLDLPGVSGFQVAQQIRASPDTGHPFIIALTGMASEQIECTAKASGFDLYLAKPADILILIMIVDSLTERDHPSKPAQPVHPELATTAVPTRRDLDRVVFETNLDARYWMQTLGVSRAQLDAAVLAVGTEVAAVRAYLQSPDRRQR